MGPDDFRGNRQEALCSLTPRVNLVIVCAGRECRALHYELLHPGGLCSLTPRLRPLPKGVPVDRPPNPVTDRNGGGIEVVPALGVEPRRIADAGQRPRFSPDGNWIAYWTCSPNRNPSSPAADKIYVVPANGGVPKQIQLEFQNARYAAGRP